MKKIIFFVTPLCLLNSYNMEAAKTESITQLQKSQEETVKTLQNLAQYEIDQSFLLSHCVNNINDTSIKENILKIKRECEDNVRILSQLIKKYGGESPTYSQDFKGYFMNGYAAMRGAFTDQGALKALHTNLKLIDKAFESALKASLPQDAKDTIKKIHEHNIIDIKDIENQI